MSLYPFNWGHLLRRLACVSTLSVALGIIIAVAAPTRAQSPRQQIPFASDQRNVADWHMGKEPIVKTIGTLDPVDSSKGKGEATNKGETNSWGRRQLKSRLWLTWPLLCCPTSTTDRSLDFRER